jgi:hypothetical protein
VFDVELKAVEMMMQESDASAAEQLLAFLEDAELLLRGEFSATVRLWIGTDDGRIYRAEMETRAYLPFLELSRGSNPNFNIETTSSARYDISGYGEPVEIEAPAQTQSA